MLTFVCVWWIHVQLIWTVDWLCYSVAILQVGRHLKRVDVDVGGLTQSHQFPQRHSEGPLWKHSVWLTLSWALIYKQFPNSINTSRVIIKQDEQNHHLCPDCRKRVVPTFIQTQNVPHKQSKETMLMNLLGMHIFVKRLKVNRSMAVMFKEAGGSSEGPPCVDPSLWPPRREQTFQPTTANNWILLAHPLLRNEPTVAVKVMKSSTL